jgi:catechol 2,3-dioxygenase-like lactoylglutathione lyase family enzyme
MLLDVTLGTKDLKRGIKFYDPVLTTLGLVRLKDGAADWAGWGKDLDSEYGLWLCPPFDGKRASVGNGTMLTFAATSAAQVRAFHRAALAHGGTDEGAPGTRERYAPSFYVAYVRDPDGHKLAAVFEPYDPTGDIA